MAPQQTETTTRETAECDGERGRGKEGGGGGNLRVSFAVGIRAVEEAIVGRSLRVLSQSMHRESERKGLLAVRLRAINE